MRWLRWRVYPKCMQKQDRSVDFPCVGHRSLQTHKFEVKSHPGRAGRYRIPLRSRWKSSISCDRLHCKVSPSPLRYFLEQDSSIPQLSRQQIDSAVATGQRTDFVRASSSRDCTLDVPPKRRSARATIAVPEPEDPRCLEFASGAPRHHPWPSCGCPGKRSERP